MSQFNLPHITAKKGAIIIGILVLFILVIGGKNSMHNSPFGMTRMGMSGGVSAMAPQFAISNDSYGGGYTTKGMMAREESGIAYPESMPPVPSQGAAPAGDAKIIKNASLALLVDNVDYASEKIAVIRDQVGGQIGNSSFNNYNAGSRTGNITIWVPAKKFDETIGLIKKLAIRVTSENVGVSDVSAQFVDMDARLNNLRVTEVQYQEILKRSGKLSDVLEVTRELSNTRSQIEQLQGQKNYLSRQVDLSSINIALAQEASPSELSNEWRPIATLKAAAKDTLRGLTAFVDSLLVLLVMLPLLLLKLAFYGLIIYAIWRIGRFIYRRMSDSLPQSGGKV